MGGPSKCIETEISYQLVCQAYMRVLLTYIAAAASGVFHVRSVLSVID